VSLAAGLTHDAGRLRRSAVHVVGGVVGTRRTWAAVVEREHLRAAAVARLPEHPAQGLQAPPIYAATQGRSSATTCSSLDLRARARQFLLGGLTGSAAAGFVAGPAFAFAPIPHRGSPLQVLSSAWMPFALFGLHRFRRGGRCRSPAGAPRGSCGNLSCGTVTLPFTPS
jgi:hypothetical protein